MCKRGRGSRRAPWGHEEGSRESAFLLGLKGKVVARWKGALHPFPSLFSQKWLLEEIASHCLVFLSEMSWSVEARL